MPHLTSRGGFISAQKTRSGGGTRTPDLVVNSHSLYPLSYSGIQYSNLKKVGEFILHLSPLKVTFLFHRTTRGFYQTIRAADGLV